MKRSGFSVQFGSMLLQNEEVSSECENNLKFPVKNNNDNSNDNNNNSSNDNDNNNNNITKVKKS
jgi:hypothetical protein